MGNARNVGGVRSRCGRRRPLPQPGTLGQRFADPDPAHLTKREAAALARRLRAQDEKKGIFRRWNNRKLTPEQQKLVAQQKKRATFHARRKARDQKPEIRSQRSEVR